MNGFTSRRARRLLPAAGLMVALAACAENAPQDTLEPAGPVARQILDLANPVFVVAGVIFVLVQGLVLVAAIKFRDRPDKPRPEPEQIHGNTRLEVGWTLVPALILFAVAIPTIATIFDLSETPDDALEVTVIGHQFWWEYRYDDLGVVTANELHIPTDRPVELTLESEDVIHSYWIPALAGKTDVVPGRSNKMYFEADRPGRFPGQCTEYCGLSHANMRAWAVAQTPADFDKWVEAQRATPEPPGEGSPVLEGLNLYTAKGCGGCHTVAGVSTAEVGPNLTHLYSRETFAGSTFELDEENLERWLEDPPAVKPGSAMPDLNLTADEIDKLIAYLETLQ